ncbi:hypothetical protein D9M68_904410 [compost metagenome]
MQHGRQHGAAARVQGHGNDAQRDDGEDGRRIAHWLAIRLRENAGNRRLPAFLVFFHQHDGQQEKAQRQRHQRGRGGNAQFIALLGRADADGTADEFRQ